MIEWEEQGQILGSQKLRDGGYNGAVPQHLHFFPPLKILGRALGSCEVLNVGKPNELVCLDSNQHPMYIHIHTRGGRY